MLDRVRDMTKLAVDKFDVFDKKTFSDWWTSTAI